MATGPTRRNLLMDSKIAVPVMLAPLTILSWLFLAILGSEQLSDVLALFVAGVGCIIMFYQAIKAIVHGNVSIDLLASIAVASAIYIHEFLPAAIVAVMLLGGQAIEEYAAGRASRAIEALVRIRPKTAIVLKGGKQETVAVDQLRSGEVVVVGPGTSIPVDGEVVSGNAFVDQSSMTGESLPAAKQIGSTVLSGTICQDGALYIKATKVGEDTKFAHIIKLVREAQASKARIQRVADRYAKWFTPVIVGLAIATYLFTGQSNRAVTVLLTASPCPLLLATPVAVVSTIGRAAKSGILIRNGDSLETAAAVDAVLFDKTGTLTFGRLGVSNLKAFNGCTETEMLSSLACAELFSTHPIAKAVHRYAAEHNVLSLAPDDFRELPGCGVMAKLEGSRILVGNSRFMEDQMIYVPKQARNPFPEDDGAHSTTLLVARNDVVCGAVALEDMLKPNAKDSVRKLRDMGIKRIAIMTGDTKKSGHKIAELLGVTDVFAQVLPEEKAAHVSELKKEGYRVAMVGDGINDAPALSTADVGIAMGAAGSDVAIETADFTIMTDGLEKVPSAIKLSRRMLRIAKQSITIGLLANLLGVSLSAFGIINPIMGATIHEFADLLVIFNSTRAFAAL